MKLKQRLFWIGLILALLLAAMPTVDAGAAGIVRVSNTGFPDVAVGTAYEEALLLNDSNFPGIFDGLPAQNGEMKFFPDWAISRADFLRWLVNSWEDKLTFDTSRNDYRSGEAYTIALENNFFIADAYSGNTPIFPYDTDFLNQSITRYEAAVLVNNFCSIALHEQMAIVENAENLISDYDEIKNYTPDVSVFQRGSFTAAVEQCVGKGIFSLRSDGSFAGNDTISRSNAVIIIFRIQNWKQELGNRKIQHQELLRKSPDGVKEAELTDPVSNFVPQESFAHWLQNGHLSGSTPDAEARVQLFGNANKRYFTSSSDAAAFMKTITIPYWTMDKGGDKHPATGTLVVHKLVADEVQQIFQRIYEDPEKYPIYGNNVGGARFSDAMRHAWGCAIDINPLYNCECNFRSGSQRVTCGYGWWPGGMENQTWVGRDAASYHGKLTEPSPYSISPSGSVVRAFAEFGWGWGGSGTNDAGGSGTARGWSSGRNFDFMHFSVLPTGG